MPFRICSEDDDIIIEAYRRASRGRSTDWLLADDDLLEVFERALQERRPGISSEAALWRLLNLRKAAKLGAGITSTRDRHDHSGYAYAAEIAARLMEDKHGRTLDKVFSSIKGRREFDRIAGSMRPDVDYRMLRLAALGLRKKRALKPEYFKRLASEAEVFSISAADAEANPDLVPKVPGIYIFRDDSKGILYIGEAENLRARLRQHLDHSDRKELARYFFVNGMERATIDIHAFPTVPEAKKKAYRTAYEAGLIQSRNPLFNIQGVVARPRR